MTPSTHDGWLDRTQSYFDSTREAWMDFKVGRIARALSQVYLTEQGLHYYVDEGQIDFIVDFLSKNRSAQEIKNRSRLYLSSHEENGTSRLIITAGTKNSPHTLLKAKDEGALSEFLRLLEEHIPRLIKEIVQDPTDGYFFFNVTQGGTTISIDPNSTSRCVAKMAFNFATDQFGPETMLNSAFDPIRDFITGKDVIPVKTNNDSDGSITWTIDVRHVSHEFSQKDNRRDSCRFLADGHSITLHAIALEETKSDALLVADVVFYGWWNGLAREGVFDFSVRLGQIPKGFLENCNLPVTLITPLGGGGDKLVHHSDSVQLGLDHDIMASINRAARWHEAEKALSVSQQRYAALNNQALILTEQAERASDRRSIKLIDLAIEKFHEALSENQNQHIVLRNWSKALLVKARRQENPQELYGEVFEKLRTADKIDPRSFVGLLLWGSALADYANKYYSESGEAYFGQAIQNYCDASQLADSDPNLLLNWGITYTAWASCRFTHGEPAQDLISEAEQRFQLGTENTTIELAGPMWRSWGDLYLLQFRISKATNEPCDAFIAESIDKYKQCIKHDSQFYAAFHQWGIALYEMAMSKPSREALLLYRSAIDRFNQALQRNTYSHQSLLCLGNCYYQISKINEHEFNYAIQKAINFYNKSINIKKNYDDALHNLGVAILDKGKRRTGLIARRLIIQARECLRLVEALKPGRVGEELAEIDRLLSIRPGRDFVGQSA
jgi:tetratricopeptide (TPR) repeat protein